MRKLVVFAFLGIVIGATAASSHEQSAVVGGKNIQPTPKSIEQKLKEHETMEKRREQGLPATDRSQKPNASR